MDAPTRSDVLRTDQQALVAVLGQVFAPVARLCLGKGVSVQAVEETLRLAFVAAAQSSCAGMNPERLTSRISTMTGLTRREVARLQASEAPARPRTRSVASDVLTAWVSHPDYIDAQGLPRRLARTGPAPSFEALASSVTRDVHATSILADMQRLGLVARDPGADTVALLESVFVPQSDWPRLIGFLGANVGDHLQASVDNVLGDTHRHFEQSLLADELSAASLEQAKGLITEQWRELMTHLAPRLQALMEQDRALGRSQDQQVRIGLYSFMSTMSETAACTGHQDFASSQDVSQPSSSVHSVTTPEPSDLAGKPALRGPRASIKDPKP